jgi:hypothetical protein
VGSRKRKRAASPRALELRLSRLLPLPAFANAAVLALAALAAYALARWLWGPALWMPEESFGNRLAPDARDFAVAALALGFVIGAVRYAFEQNGRDLARIAGEGAISRPGGRRNTPLTRRRPLRRARAVGALGALAGAILLAVVDPYAGAPGVWLPGRAAAQVLQVLLFGALARAIWFTAEATRDFDGLIQATPEIDLLRLEPLFGFGRIGLRLAFIWIVGLTLFLLLSLFGGAWRSTLAFAPVMALIGGTAVAALLLPVRTLHRRIAASKSRELAWLRGELNRLYGEVRADLGSGVPGRIADLRVLEDRVRAVREWPFEPSTIVRFVFYLLIPVGSWFAGAFVERLVSAALD